MQITKKEIRQLFNKMNATKAAGFKLVIKKALNGTDSPSE